MAAPRLEVEQADGTWRTAVEDIGVPVGRPQTLVVDLAGKLAAIAPRPDRHDHARLLGPGRRRRAGGRGRARPAAAPTPRRPTLRERGFSAEASPDGREPLGYDYARVSLALAVEDDAGPLHAHGRRAPAARRGRRLFRRLEAGRRARARLRRAARCRRCAPGWARTFLLHGDGFSKEMDINSASPDVVLPLPYHGMKAVPVRRAADAPPRARRRPRPAEAWNTRWYVSRAGSSCRPSSRGLPSARSPRDPQSPRRARSPAARRRRSASE